MRTDIEIAEAAVLEPIENVAASVGIDADYLECYGKYKAKIADGFYESSRGRADGKLILVTAINPTPAGEGKTTVSVGLTDALRKLGKSAALALREPSLGPVFGVKGGAAGGGYAQVVPMADINLHFTGDIHAVTAANNLLAALIDNHIYQGNELGIDAETVIWRRCLDINDRQLRSIECGLGGKFDGVPRRDGFDITAASEIMAVLCLADNLGELTERLSRMVVGYDADAKPVTAGQLGAAGALAVLLKDAIKPNLVQTLEGTPAFIHGGPFANIAHGCNSVIATKTALKAADYVVTEAGFGADLGAEKFIDVKCRTAGLAPSAVVIVATVRALKHHGSAEKSELSKEDLKALSRGLPNLIRHIENMKTVFSLPVAIAVNRFATDTDAELGLIVEAVAEHGVKAIVTDVWGKGADGGVELAGEVVRLCEQKSELSFAYESDADIRTKLSDLARRVYRADAVLFSELAEAKLAKLSEDGFGALPVCVAKTQYSFSDDAKLLGAPSGFSLTVRDLKLSAGAGFIVALCGRIMTMPGLPKVPAAYMMDVDGAGRVTGLF
ncbi:MAG: formate--tetrahydrofolate ligase [Oscillospiraceae bacterium]|nr:formate--tetrahydrofolate ligase [Oscillospiraceae bacterium]